MTAAVVIGLGNIYRRDDGVGPAVAAAVEELDLPGVRVVRCAAETTAILDAWAAAGLAVVVDAAAGGTPGRVRRCELEDLVEGNSVSCHELNLRQTYELARVLGRAPDRVVVVSVDAADVGYGPELSSAVRQSVPHAAEMVVAELAAR